MSVDEPRIITLCGSMRFREEIERLAAGLTLAGHVVLRPTALDPDVELTVEERARLGRLHLEKVARADEVLVVNVSGYIGESTRREIDHARSLGMPVTFLEPPVTGNVAIAVAALVRDGRLLLAHRHPERAAYPDRWDLVGGHVEPGETPADAVRRECLEEIGVTVVAMRPLPLETPDPGLDLHGFLVTDWLGVPTNLAPDEHDDLRWFTSDEVLELPLALPVNLPRILAVLGSPPD